MTPDEQLHALDDYLRISSDFHLSIVTGYREETTRKQEKMLVSLCVAGRLIRTAVGECLAEKARSPAIVYARARSAMREIGVRERVHAMLGHCAEQGAPNAAPRTVLPTARILLNRYLPLRDAPQRTRRRELPDRRNVPGELVDSLLHHVYADVRGPDPRDLEGCCDAIVHELGETGLQRVERLLGEQDEAPGIANHAIVLATILAAQRTLLKKEPARAIIIDGLRPRPEGEWNLEA